MLQHEKNPYYGENAKTLNGTLNTSFFAITGFVDFVSVTQVPATAVKTIAHTAVLSTLLKIVTVLLILILPPD